LKQDHGRGDTRHAGDEIEYGSQPDRRIVASAKDKVRVIEHVVVKKQYRNVDESKGKEYARGQ
jgi:hypothetical protein